MHTIEELLKDKLRLPSPPVVAVRILDAVKRDTGNWEELVSIIRSDLALTAKVLQIANSPYYAPAVHVNSIEKALSILGVEALKNIALSFVICRGMKGHAQGSFDFDYFWKRAITAAVAAELTAVSIKKKSDDIFVTALLQDIGIPILYYNWPNEYLQVLDEKKASGLPIQEVEKKRLGFAHPDLSSEILKNWGLPEDIYMPIRYHHSNESVPEAYKTQKEMLLLSNKLSSLYHGAKSMGKIQEIKDILQQNLQVRDHNVDGLIDAVAEKSIEIISSFEMDPGNMKPFSQIIQEANEELCKLSLSNVHLMMEFKQVKEKAERLAIELKEAHDKLRELNTRDGLTGLYNHRFFQEALDQEISRALRYGRPIALVLFDIDYFKKMNHTYGHSSGDLVLINLGKEVKRLVRANDIAARYTAEEFAILMPETDLGEAMVQAERLRKAFEDLEIEINGSKIKMSVSLGVTGFKEAVKVAGSEELIALADKALYVSKQSRRNKVTAVQFTGS